MLTGQQKIEIGEVCCAIGFEEGFFQNESEAIFSSYRKWGFCSDGLPDMRIVVKGNLSSPPSRTKENLFYHSIEYDSVCSTLLFDTEKFEGEIGFIVKKADKFTPVRIVELIETFISNAYIFYFFLHDKGTFIHSCGVADEGNGYIFAGPSGEGKSTIAKLSCSRTVLCDEMVLLKKNGEGRKKVYGTPFSGESGSVNMSSDCKGIYFIEKSRHNEILPMSKTAAVVTLMKEGVMGGFTSIDSIQRIYPFPRYLSLLFDLLEGVPCYRMRFKKDKSFWEVL